MDEMAGYRPQWEYRIEYNRADTQIPRARAFLEQHHPGKDFPKYAVQALHPRLNEMGADGWELIQMQPVRLGDNGDVQVGYAAGSWTNIYLCVFKRLKRSAQQ